MIAYLKGALLDRQPTRVILDVQGVGYELHIPVSTFAELPPAGAPAALYVYTQVREDAIQLFGFGTAREKRLFEKLIGVNGVGPKLGLAILSGMNPDALAAALRQGDIVRLVAIPGVGKKTAERLVMELRDKMGPQDEAEAAAAAPRGGTAEDVISAMVNLGYAQPLAEKAVLRALEQHPDTNFDALFTACMKAIGR